MSIPVLNTRATIDDFYKGKMGDIIFDSYGKNDDYIIFCPEKLAYILGRDMIDSESLKEKITDDDINSTVDNCLWEVREYITKYLKEYIEDNYDGEYIPSEEEE